MDTNSTPEVASERKPKGRIGKLVLRGALAVILAVGVAHLAWKYSGSNQWKKVGERKGVTLYSMKSPGATIEKFKAVWKIHGNLSRLVMWVNDTKPDKKHRPMGLYDLRILERHGDRGGWTAYKQPIASFLRPREFVIKTELSQNPQTKALLYTVTAFPDSIPPDDCCVRVRVMDNRWTLTPLKTGDLEVEWFVNMDIGGAIPYVLQNAVQPDGMLNFAPSLQKFMDREKYKDAKYDWIQEAEPSNPSRSSVALEHP
jgi:hypothetical protein